MRRCLALALVALLSACSRSATDAPAVSRPSVPAPSTVEAIAAAARPMPPVLFVGLDGADWQLLDDYIAQGTMPNLARLVREGTSGVLETSRPALSPLVWTTMMTGQSPLAHGILDFVAFNPHTGVKEPIASSSRRVPAIWNMATLAGKKLAALGLWATFPAEPVNGLMISDRLFNFLFGGASAGSGVVYPPERQDWALDAVQRAEQAVGFDALKAYLPWLTEAEYARYVSAADPYAHPISALRRILVETHIYDELGRAAFERDQPDVALLYLQGPDSVGHVFAPYAPPQQPGVAAGDFERYRDVPEKYFRGLDAQLGAYMGLVAARGGALFLASDHGFFWKDGRPSALSSSANATAAQWHRASGMYALWGAGIAAGGHDRTGSVEQVCATLLALAGLPPGQDVHGEPLSGAPAMAGRTRADYQAYYQPPPAPAADPSRTADADSLAKLKALGYIADAGSPGRPGETRTPGSYNNEGVILRNAGKRTEAIAAFERALRGDPNLASALWNLSDLLFGDPGTADRSDQLLVRAYGSGLPEGNRLLIGRAIGYQRAGQIERSLALISGGLEARPNEAELWLFRGRYRVDTGDCRGAAADFRRAAALVPGDPAPLASEGVAQLCAGDQHAARTALSRALQLDPDQPKVREILNSLDRQR